MTAGKDKIYAVLATRTVRLPYETKEEQEKADKMNAEIAHLGVSFSRAATDWAYRPYEQMRANMTFSQIQRRQHQRTQPAALQSGDLVRVFRTVKDGDVCWNGVIKLDHTHYFRGTQANENEEEWEGMFFDQMPAKLVRKDGKVVYGALEPFCETGTEGIVWSVHEYGVPSYPGLHCLEDGDELTVYSTVRDGDVEWEGVVDFGPQKVTKIDWTEILREAKHMDTKDWLQMCWQNRPVVITPR
jgi:hypothetical protein